MPRAQKAVVHVGTSGWAIPARYREEFAAGASVLHRYASRFNAVEINSSFYRSHQKKTYERWADSVGSQFRFSVKVPKSVTHELRLANCRKQISSFCSEISGLGVKLGVVLVQLPPSLAFDRRVAGPFFGLLAKATPARIACEPRHSSWFGGDADETIKRFRIARVAADPAIVPEASDSGGYGDFAYFRLHGAPKLYDSEYSGRALLDYARRLNASAGTKAAVWCFFDNTMHGYAVSNALSLNELVSGRGAGAARRSTMTL